MFVHGCLRCVFIVLYLYNCVVVVRDMGLFVWNYTSVCVCVCSASCVCVFVCIVLFEIVKFWVCADLYCLWVVCMKMCIAYVRALMCVLFELYNCVVVLRDMGLFVWNYTSVWVGVCVCSESCGFVCDCFDFPEQIKTFPPTTKESETWDPSVTPCPLAHGFALNAPPPLPQLVLFIYIPIFSRLIYIIH